MSGVSGNTKTLTDRNSLKEYLQGTCISVYQAVETLELDPDIDWEDELLSDNLETCLGCGWWHESGELVHEDDNDTGYCEQCIEDKEE